MDIKNILTYTKYMKMGVWELRKSVVSVMLALLLTICVGLTLYAAFQTTKHKYDIEEINEGRLWKQVTDEIFISRGAYEKVNMVLVTSIGDAALIDAGCNKKEALRVKDYLKSNNLTVTKIFLTHRHSDHTENLSMFDVGEENIYDFNNTSDNDIIKVGEKSFKILHTPGHTNEDMSIELVEDNVLAAGDIVLTSLPPIISPSGDMDTLIKSLERIKNNNYSLIIPGHGDLLDAKQSVEMQLEYLEKVE